MDTFKLDFEVDDKVIHVPSGRTATVYRLKPMGVRHAFSIKWDDNGKNYSIFGRKKCNDFKKI